MAIRKPPKACPAIEAVSHVAELIAVAAGRSFLGTIFEINAKKTGPEKDLIAPVMPMIMNIIVAIFHGFIVLSVWSSDKKIKHKMQQT